MIHLLVFEQALAKRDIIPRYIMRNQAGLGGVQRSVLFPEMHVICLVCMPRVVLRSARGLCVGDTG